MRGDPASRAGAIVVIFTGDGELVFGQQVETSNNRTGDVKTSLHVLFQVAFTIINEIKLFHKSAICRHECVVGTVFSSPPNPVDSAPSTRTAKDRPYHTPAWLQIRLP